MEDYQYFSLLSCVLYIAGCTSDWPAVRVPMHLLSLFIGIAAIDAFVTLG